MYMIISYVSRIFLVMELVYQMPIFMKGLLIFSLLTIFGSASSSACASNFFCFPQGDLVQEETFAEVLVDHCEEAGSLFGNLDFERRFSKVTPLYQRVLSALIVEDEIEDYEEINVGRSMSVQNTTCGFPYDMLIEAEPRKRDGMEFECDSMLGMSSFDCQYEQMCLNDKLLLELQSIDLYPDIVVCFTCLKS